MKRLLVANRGEIAVRVFDAARSLGLTTVAVHTDVDANAAHVAAAEVAVRLGDGGPRAYLDADAVVAAAVRSGADAVHPGYGFLSEDAAFARAVIDAGLTWVGPAPEVIATMGDKLAAKAVAEAAGVPLLASTALEGDDPTLWHGQLDEGGLGWPVLVKAAAGGGGRGMRVVEGPDDLADAVLSARREAAAAFGDGRVYAERLVRGGRHVEVQLLGDGHGNLVHLGERECSVQRRHQKLVEEAPSPGITAAVRERLTAAAVALGRHLGYQGAGTVEFLVDGEGDDAAIAFLEVNTRLQVEHRVTELVTGLDLVVLQLEIAAGRALGFTQDDVATSGHAIEVRLYAEDPAAGFAPTFGTLHRLRFPDPSPGTRAVVDAAVVDGDLVGTDYDPLLAKVVHHHERREVAVATLARRLRAGHIHGVVTNRELLVATLEHPQFVAGDATTAFLDHHPQVAAAGPDDTTTAVHAAAVATARAYARQQTSPWPWAPAGWRNVPSVPGEPRPSDPDGETDSSAGPGAATSTTADDPTGPHRSPTAIAVGDRRSEATDTQSSPTSTVVDQTGCDAEVVVEHQGLTHRVQVHLRGATAWANGPGGQTTWVQQDPLAATSAGTAGAAGEDRVVAPLPGTVVTIEVAEGEAVTAGQTLVVLEAMKMEHRLEAPADATVVEVLVAQGERVDAHQVLVRLG